MGHLVRTNSNWNTITTHFGCIYGCLYHAISKKDNRLEIVNSYDRALSTDTIKKDNLFLSTDFTVWIICTHTDIHTEWSGIH
jgi:Trk-type K+ transport system membrane component